MKKSKCSTTGCLNKKMKGDTRCYKCVRDKYYSVWFRPYQLTGTRTAKHTLDQFDNTGY